MGLGEIKRNLLQKVVFIGSLPLKGIGYVSTWVWDMFKLLLFKHKLGGTAKYNLRPNKY